MESHIEKPILIAKDISKTFFSTKVLDHVSLELMPGEVHALMGENGAGKSTLSKCITGIYQAEEGQFFYKGKEVHFSGPKEALNEGIAIVLQEFNTIPDLSVAENIFLTDKEYYKKGHIVDFELMARKADEMLRYFNMRELINPLDKMNTLSVAEMQIIEIIKAMTKNAKVIILDEPTATLSNKEIDRLFRMINELKKEGVSFIIVSHKINEIFEISDRITVLRDGRNTLSGSATSQMDELSLIKAMVGREITNLYGQDGTGGHTVKDEIALKVEHVSDSVGRVKDCSFEIKKGEIVGIAGLVGAGRTELARCIFGIDPRTSGKVTLYGEEIPKNSVRDSIRKGMVYLSEKRKEEGLHQKLSIINNISLVKETLSRTGKLNFSQEEKDASRMVSLLNIKATDVYSAVTNLSGGNQQKVLLAKWLLASPRLLIIDEPTRGIDIASKHEIYEILRKLAQEDISIVMISSEMNEILGVTDRILVVREGRIVASIQTADATEEKVGYYATIGEETDNA